MITFGTAITTNGLTKRFDKEILAVDQIDLTIPTNTIYALLGPNGIGKVLHPQTARGCVWEIAVAASGRARQGDFEQVGARPDAARIRQVLCSI